MATRTFIPHVCHEAIGVLDKDASGGLAMTRVTSSVFAQGSFLVLARNPVVFASRYPGVPVLGPYIGSLENGGETITLSHPSGATVLSVAYGDRSPWPVAADGYGFSLVQASVAPSQAPDDGNKWRASRSVHGSPGADDAANVIPAIYVSELLAHADLPLRDTVELFNPNPTNVNIGGWFLSDSFNAGVERGRLNSLRGFGHHDGTSAHRMRTKSRLPSGSVTTFSRADGFIVIPRQQEFIDRELLAKTRRKSPRTFSTRCIGRSESSAATRPCRRGFTVLRSMPRCRGCGPRVRERAVSRTCVCRVQHL